VTQNKIIDPGTRRHKEERKKLVRNQRGKTVGRRKRLETFHPSTGIKQQ
jgi:hypothetical protein